MVRFVLTEPHGRNHVERIICFLRVVIASSSGRATHTAHESWFVTPQMNLTLTSAMKIYTHFSAQ